MKNREGNMSKYCGKFGICHKKKAIAAAVLAASLAAQNMMPVMAGGGISEHPHRTSRIASSSNADWKATPSSAQKATPSVPEKNILTENIVPNGSFEETTKATAAWKDVWVDQIIPKGWGTWKANAGSMMLEVVNDPTEAPDGEKYIHAHSEIDKNARYSVNIPIKTALQKDMKYLCTFKMKTENVEGTGVYVRLAWLIPKSQTDVETVRYKGTTDGWQEFGITTKNTPPENATGMQIDIFFEKFTGDVFIDDIQLTPAYSVNLNEKEATLFVNETKELKATLTEGFEELESSIVWSSENPEIAEVDENGVVTAHAVGVTKIVAEIDSYHRAECEISVEDESLRPYYKTMRDNWRERLTGNNIEDPSDAFYQQNMETLTQEAQEIWTGMNKGGNERESIWDDIDFVYNFQKTTDSKATTDLNTGFSRIETLARAYNSEGCDLYHNEELKNDIISALEWVYATMYNDTMSAQKDIYGNWWHWFIGMPKSLCNTVIMMYDELDQDLIQREAKTLKNFNWDPNYRYVPISGSLVKNEAGNLIDTSQVAALRGAIGETSKPLAMAQEALSKSLGYVTSGNGYYEDGSYIDHTNLAYTGGYGSTLLNGIERIHFVITDTPWDIESEKMTSVFEWILNGIRPLFADGASMDMASGRGVARPSTNEHTVGRGLMKPIVHLAAIAPEEMRQELQSFVKTEVKAGMQYNEEYFKGMTVADITAIQKLLKDDSIEEDTEIYHKNFGAMDKATYHGENFDLGISMYSERTGSFEYGNHENKRGWHQSDGAVYLYNGDQEHYADVYWPTVDAHRLAGITTDHTEGYIPSGNKWGAHTSSKDWVGGSSVLGQFGSVGMDFEGELPTGAISSLKAKKSWFTFPNMVVALGAGIQSNEGKETETIVENRKVNDGATNTIWVNGEETEFTVGEMTEKSMRWALLEGNKSEAQNIGYYFPEETTVNVLKENRVGNWRDINGAIKEGSSNDAPIERSYISLAVDHGTNPQGETYSYVLLPGRTLDEMEAFAQKPEIKILANTEEVQAVENTEYGVSGYNFWTAANVEGLEVSAETPASVTIAKDGNTMTMGISNPTQNGKEVRVVLQGYYQIKEISEEVSVINQAESTIIQVEGAKDFGKTYEIVLEKVDISERLNLWQKNIEEAMLSDYKQVEMILEEAKKENTYYYTNEQKEQLAAIIKMAEEKLDLMVSVDRIVGYLDQVDKITYENADAVEELLKQYDAMTEEQKALLSEKEKTAIEALRAGFQSSEIYTEAENVQVQTINKTMDIRTLFAITERADMMSVYQEQLPENQTLVSLFCPTLTLKGENLSFTENPVRVTMQIPKVEEGKKGSMKLYYFAPIQKTRTAGFTEIEPENVVSTVTFTVDRNGFYGFVFEEEKIPENPDPEKPNEPDTNTSSSGSRKDFVSKNIKEGDWVLQNNKWWYRFNNGTWPASQWKQIDGIWYHFDRDGYMETGWIMDEGRWYYLHSNGAMASYEWIGYHGKWYFMAENGEMMTNTSIVWKGSIYQLRADGSMEE